MKILGITTCMNNLKQLLNFRNTYLTEWFQQQTEFTTEFEAMEVNEMNKCLSKFYVSVRRKDGTFYKRNSLLSVLAKLFTDSTSSREIFTISKIQLVDYNQCCVLIGWAITSRLYVIARGVSF